MCVTLLADPTFGVFVPVQKFLDKMVGMRKTIHRPSQRRREFVIEAYPETNCLGVEIPGDFTCANWCRFRERLQ